MLAEPDGHDSKMEDACSQKVSCGDTLTSHFFQTEQSPFLMFFFPFLRALESSCLYFDPPSLSYENPLPRSAGLHF